MAYGVYQRKSTMLSWLLFLCFYTAGSSCVPAQVSSSIAPGAAKVQIDNERVAVSDATLSPGKSESLDTYRCDFVTMFLTDGTFQITDMNGRSRVVTHRAGEATFTPKGSDRSEKVTSDQPVMIVRVELKRYPASPSINKTKYPDAFPRPGSIKVFENDHVVIWNYAWTSGVPTPTHYHYRDLVVVYREDGTLKATSENGESVVTDHTVGEFRFVKAGKTHYEELEKGKESAIILELK